MESKINQFQLYGTLKSFRPYGNGHIHDTYLIQINQGGTMVPYIMQRINTYVFKKPKEVMKNIVKATDHIRQKLIIDKASDISRRVLEVIPNKDGSFYYTDSDGDYWRIYIYIANTVSYDTLRSNKQIFQVAKIFGDFHKTLADIDISDLHETIPDFHNGLKRFADFENALNSDHYDRSNDAKEEIDFLIKNAGLFKVIPRLIREKKIPVRVTHNDTKVNNVLFDRESDKSFCIIDLDTIMPGVSLYDFGDLARTSLSNSAEDEKVLSRVFMQIPRFESLLNGYLSSAGEILNKYEINHLVHGAKLITLMIGMRFLTDYLSNDIYFKIKYPEHNLDRCRTQFKIVKSIQENEEQLNKIVEKSI